MERVKTLLCAATLAVLPLSAHADETLSLDCGQPTIYLGKTGTNPAVRAVVSHNYESSLWSVVYYLANGTPVYRESQYTITDTTNEAIAAGPLYLAGWSGTLNRQSNLIMYAAVTMDEAKQHLYYAEWLYDTRNTDASGKPTLVMRSAAPCTTTHVPDSFTEQARRAPAPAPAPHTPAFGEDSIGITVSGTHVAATISVGSYWAKMMIDTSASEMSVVEGLAQKLLDEGEATPLPDASFTMANGKAETERRISIKTVKIGTHELHDIAAGIVPEGSAMLLPFPVLNMVGKFTVDTVSAKLIFG
jgi:predicted aspartyl protease